MSARPAALLARVALLLCLARAAFAGGGPAETVVLVNRESADSRRVADHYVRARGIPPQQVCEVRCTASPDVPMADFVRDVVDPLREFLRKRRLEDRCRFVVLTQGMPIRARTPGGDVSTTAALSLLDTSLCGMPQTRMPGVRNPYTSGPAPTGAVAGGGRFLLATALLSTTAEEAIALVDRSVASDGTAPRDALFLYQDAKPAAHVRNDAYDGARARIEAEGARTERVGIGADRAAKRRRVMGYMAGGSYSELTPEGVATIEYLPGAISDHLQSFGAVPGNFDADRAKHQQFPVTHMVRAGVTGVHGAVAEPYNVAFPDADLFLPYLRGATLAEAFHQRMPLAYWMNLVLGDPLCAPYAERPRVTVEGAPPGTWKGSVSLEVRAPGAVRTALYVNGIEVAAGEGGSLAAEVDTSYFADGTAHVLAEAVGPGEYEPRGWTVISPTLRNSVASDVFVVRGGTPATDVAVEVPPEVRAGEEFLVRVTPRIADPTGRWKGRIEVRLSDPPVRIAARDAESAGSAIEVPARFLRSGDVSLRVTLPDDGVERTSRLRVRAGPASHATSPLAAVPLLQATDVDVVVEDEYGNLAEDFDRELRMAFPDDPEASVPGPVRVVRGRAVFRDVVLTRPGRRTLVLSDADGRRWTLASEGVDALPAPIRAWLVSTPARDAESVGGAEADPAEGADADGSVVGERLFRRTRIRGDDVAFPGAAARDGDAGVAVAFLDASAAAKVRLLGSAPARLRVLLDGRAVFDGVPPAEAGRGKRAPLAEVDLAAGPHRLTVIAEREERFAFSLQIDDGKGGAVPAVRVLGAPEGGAPPVAFAASGRVRRGTSGLAGARVSVRGADGRSREAVSGPDGTWWVDGLPPGDVVVRADAGPRKLVPAERRLTLAGAHAVDLDFSVEDRVPPKVQADAGKGRFGRRMVVLPAVEDDDAVREVRLLLGGAVLARATAAPWRLEADVASLPRGKQAFEVVADDASGNTGRAPLAVHLIEDRAGPSVAFRGLAPNAYLRKRTEVTADATDDLPVAEVRFSLDGKDLATRTAPPFAADLDPASLAEGSHVLVATARDLDGNETRAELRFRVR